MNKRFIVIVEDATEQQHRELANYVTSAEISWWHWLDSLWLLVDNKGKISAASLRDICKEIFPQKNFMVFEVPTFTGEFITGQVRSQAQKSTEDWLKNVWQKK